MDRRQRRQRQQHVVRRLPASVSRVLRRSTRRAGSPRAPTSLARGDRPARACRPFRHRRTPRRNPETENTMDLSTLIAQWSGKTPPGFVPPAVLSAKPPRCQQRRCKRPCAVKANGEWARSCQKCLDRRAASCRRRRAAKTAEGGCSRCAYRQRLAGDFLCQRCRDDRDRGRAQKRQDAIDAAAIDELAAQPERVHKASNLDLGISPWNGRPAPEASAAYWSPLPDPEPPSEQGWRWSLMNGKLHHRY